jgi:hypothetical protein
LDGSPFFVSLLTLAERVISLFKLSLMIVRNVSFQCRWISLVIILITIGCSASGPPPRGIVRFDDGEPVQSGSVEFRSLDNGQRYAGRIASDGSFELQDQNAKQSFPPGEYEVVVVQIVLTEDLAIDAHQHGRTVPRHYADYYTSKLRISNQADRTDPIVVELLSSP